MDGFVSEGAQPAELGWGTHEKHFPADGGRHQVGSGCAIYLNRPGASTRVRTWTPKAGHFHGFLITHSEAISLADYYTVREGERVVYRPTTHYAYHPSDNAVLSVHELAGPQLAPAGPHKRIMLDEITEGIDELGVLLAGHQKNAYWYGSQLSIEEARSSGAVQQRHQPAGHRGGARRDDLGDGESGPRHRRAGRDGLPAPARRSACRISAP